jgi:hypothetical protein
VVVAAWPTTAAAAHATPNSAASVKSTASFHREMYKIPSDLGEWDATVDVKAPWF